ncbi:MAG TPA: hypothetical protein VH062_03925 [Polyangiaceae bacterium]|nr:hypothetical protein [Polyangiaceae bacterium]
MRASKRSIGRVVLGLAVSQLVAACSLFVDFDRSKIHETGGTPNHGGAPGSGGAGTGGRVNAGGSGPGGSGGSGGANVDAGMGGSIDAGSGGAGGMGVEGGADHMSPPAACDVKTHEGCAADELCCPSTQGARCEKTSVDECEACGKPCPSTLAKSCDERTCVCDPATNRACSGTGPERFCAQSGTADPACVECLDATDCATRTDGNNECVAGKCVACDPAKGNSGCSGNTPICDSATMACKACSSSPNNCGGALVCTPSGSCGGCATSATDCVTPTTPICDGASTECRGCASNAECTTERSLAFCIDTTRCSPCQPTTEQGCADPTKPDCRLAVDGNFSCQACTSDDHCKNLAATPVCDVPSGKCVACGTDNDCTGNSKKPLCVGNVCVGCDSVAPAATADQRCAAKPGGAAVCVESGTQKSQCGACDPTSSDGCASSELCCEKSGVASCAAVTPTQCTACGVACNPTVANTCADRGCQCGASAPCTGTGTSRFCIGSPGSCVECKADTDCTDPAAPLCVANQCAACDATAGGDARCASKSASTPQCASAGAQKGHCSACDPIGNAGCGGTTQCDSTTATCLDCIDDSGCIDVPKTPICGANSCRACASDSECKQSASAAGPLCGTSGACAVDGACSSSGDCTDGVHTTCVDVNQGSGSPDNRCRVCNPGNNDGCTGPQTCGPDFTCGN